MISDVREGGGRKEGGGGGERVGDTMIEFMERQSLCCKLYLVWCIGSGFSFFSSFTTNLASVRAICISCSLHYYPLIHVSLITLLVTWSVLHT